MRRRSSRMVLSADPEQDPGSRWPSSARARRWPFPIFRSITCWAACASAWWTASMIANPTYDEGRESKLNIVVAGTEEGIVMVEAGAQQVSEAEVLGAIEYGHECCKKIAEGIRELVKMPVRPSGTSLRATVNQDAVRRSTRAVRAELKDALNTQKYRKLESYARVDRAASRSVIEALPKSRRPKRRRSLRRSEGADLPRRDAEGAPPSGWPQVRRDPSDHRSKSGVLPRTHGSALFTRGETQALVTATLGTKDDEQRIELLDPAETFKRFMLHYNFPPFSVGEVGFMRGAGRREIGHGALAERALGRCDSRREERSRTRCAWSATFWNRTVPAPWPRVCGATLALMDAGVPIASPVARRRDGLVKEGDKYAVLTDIAGAEDHYGDMDFKVAGTKDGITALQMDIKVPNVTHGHHDGSAGAGARGPPAHPGQDERGARGAARRRCRRTRRASTPDRFRRTRSAS